MKGALLGGPGQRREDGRRLVQEGALDQDGALDLAGARRPALQRMPRVAVACEAIVQPGAHDWVAVEVAWHIIVEVREKPRPHKPQITPVVAVALRTRNQGDTAVLGHAVTARLRAWHPFPPMPESCTPANPAGQVGNLLQRMDDALVVPFVRTRVRNPVRGQEVVAIDEAWHKPRAAETNPAGHLLGATQLAGGLQVIPSVPVDGRSIRQRAGHVRIFGVRP